MPAFRSDAAVEALMDEWQQVWVHEMRVNFLSVADLSKLAIRHFRTNGGERIVNMASRASQRGYPPNTMAHGASKAALINLTKPSHKASHESVISVALAPGWVRTEMAEAYAAQHGEAALAGIPSAAWPRPKRSASSPHSPSAPRRPR